MVLNDCDYLTTPRTVYGVKGRWPADARRIYVKPVYERRRETWHKVVDKPGETGERFIAVDPSRMRHLSARPCPDGILGEEGPWSSMYRALRTLGVPAAQIGIFGSRRLRESGMSFRPKDTDFVIFGASNCTHLRDHMQYFHDIAGTSPISAAHVRSQVRRHAVSYDAKRNTFDLLLANKWSSCQVSEGVCSTLRFVLLSDEQVGLPSVADCLEAVGETVEIYGIVQSSIGMSFVPRRFELEVAHGSYEVCTASWIYHQSLCDGDHVGVTGVLVGGRLVLNRYSHGIRIIKNAS